MIDLEFSKKNEIPELAYFPLWDSDTTHFGFS